jgi:hypothetical protein
VNAISTRRYTTTTDEPVSGAAGAPAVGPLVESTLYVCALIADQPRAIDRYIDYFGERRNTPSSPVASGPAVSNHEATTPIAKACVP